MPQLATCEADPGTVVDRGRWLAIGLALLGSLAAIVGALVGGPALPGQAATHTTPAALAALRVLGGTFGVLGCIGTGLALVWRRVGTATLLMAAGGLTLTGFAVPAGLALLLGAVLIPVERRC